jgi:hypothetical protein
VDGTGVTKENESWIQFWNKMPVKETEKNCRLLQFFKISWFYYIFLQPFICIYGLYFNRYSYIYIQLLCERTYTVYSL